MVVSHPNPSLSADRTGGPPKSNQRSSQPPTRNPTPPAEGAALPGDKHRTGGPPKPDQGSNQPPGSTPPAGRAERLEPPGDKHRTAGPSKPDQGSSQPQDSTPPAGGVESPGDKHRAGGPSKPDQGSSQPPDSNPPKGGEPESHIYSKRGAKWKGKERASSSESDTSLDVTAHWSDDIDLVPMLPKSIERYNRPRMRRADLVHRRVKHIKMHTVELRPAYHIANWEHKMHPGGSRYHRYSRGKKRMSMVTDEDVSPPFMAGMLVACAKRAYAAVDPHKTIRGVAVEIVLEITSDSRGRYSCGYYFVDYKKRFVFWAEDVSADIFGTGIRLADSSHLSFGLQSEFWRHCSLFPPSLETINHLGVEHWHDVLNQLRDCVSYGETEVMVSDSPICPFDLKQLRKIGKRCDNALARIRHQCSNPSNPGPGTKADSLPERKPHPLALDISDTDIVTWATFLQIFVASRLVNYHDRRNPRLTARQPLFEEGMNNRKPFARFAHIVSKILFLGSDVQKHLHILCHLWVDDPDLMGPSHWKGIIAELCKEWKRFASHSTILMAVDVGSLTVPGIPPSATALLRLSGVLAISSLAMISLILAGALNDRERLTSGGPVSFLVKIRGMKTLALMHSLPYPLLAWGVILLNVAWWICIIAMESIIARIIGVVVIGLSNLFIILCKLQLEGMFRSW